MKNVETIANNPHQAGNARLVPDVTFAKVADKELKMQVLVPWSLEVDPNLRFPTVLFLQGSGWTFPDVNYELPQLAVLARRGYVVATITHRSYADGFPMPAFLKDSKTAIRFLRTHAAEFGVDVDRIGFWGTSSGGNTAQLVALTGDDSRYQTAEWQDASDQVACAVSCFGPTDLNDLYEGFPKAELAENVEKMLGGPLSKEQELIKAMSPLAIVASRKTDCPMFLLHGTADQVVPYQQSERLFDELTKAGIDTQLLLVEGADHEGDFWSQTVYDRIFAFFDKNL